MLYLACVAGGLIGGFFLALLAAGERIAELIEQERYWKGEAGRLRLNWEKCDMGRRNAEAACRVYRAALAEGGDLPPGPLPTGEGVTARETAGTAARGLPVW